ncbi:MAG: NF038104 family lipoprotein [Pseudomonadota bacterium]
MTRFIAALLIVLFTSGCVGTVVETVTDTAIAVAKVPFKVGGAVVDAVSDDDEDE